jgi:urease accessory protein UreH
MVREGFVMLSGRITQRFYFGDSVEYQVRLGPSTMVKVVGPSTERFQVDEDVQAWIHPQHVVVVRGS